MWLAAVVHRQSPGCQSVPRAPAKPAPQTVAGILVIESSPRIQLPGCSVSMFQLIESRKGLDKMCVKWRIYRNDVALAAWHRDTASYCENPRVEHPSYKYSVYKLTREAMLADTQQVSRTSDQLPWSHNREQPCVSLARLLGACIATPTMHFYPAISINSDRRATVTWHNSIYVAVLSNFSLFS